MRKRIPESKTEDKTRIKERKIENKREEDGNKKELSETHRPVRKAKALIEMS